MKAFITCLLCFSAAVLVGLYTYFRAAAKKSGADAISAVWQCVKSWFNSGYSLYSKNKKREYTFPYLVRAAEPFSHIIADDLHLCKRCKLWETAHINEDVYSISFKLFGIIAACDESELRELLTTELQEVYASYFGQVYPFVYAVSFDRNTILFWIAANLYGNDLIQQRANLDYYSEGKEPGVLEDV